MLRARVVATLIAIAWLVLPGGGHVIAAEDFSWRTEPVTIVTSGGRHEFTAEIADKPDLRARGLMYRSRIDDDRAMLFDFGEVQPVSMWMKNTFISLDMLFIASDGKIVNIARWTTPGSTDVIESKGDVRAVLEVNGGTADRLKIRPGDRVLHPIFGNH